MPGQYVDLETGLYQNWWRDYDPALGRYMQADQIRLAGGANLYGYAGANPVSYIDPEGQHPILWLGHLGGVGAAGGWALWDIINGCPIDYEGAFNAGMTAFDVMTLGAGSHVSLGVKALQGVGRKAAGAGAAAGKSAQKATNGRAIQGKTRTGSATKTDPHHAFNNIIDNYADGAQKFDVTTRGKGGEVVRTSELRQLEGSLNGKDGIFEWIIDQGNVTHRRFIPNGKITGTPNQVIKK